MTVVGIYYAPDSTGIAPYTTDLCATLVAAGASVHAVVGVPHYPRWQVDDAYRSRRRFRYEEDLGGVRVTRVRHFVPRSQDALRRGLYEVSFRVGSGLASAGHRPDIVLGVTPNLAGAATAAALARRRGVPLGLIVQDLVGPAATQSGIRGGSRVARLARHLEARVLRQARRVGVITDAHRPLVLSTGTAAGAIDTLPNYVHVQPSGLSRDEARRALGWPVRGGIALHSGNMGLKQDLGNVVEAARLALDRPDDLTFVLLGDGSTRAALRTQARGVANLRMLDPLPDELYPAALAAADCLLLNERPSVLDMSMPSKLTSYFAAGRPVVAATHPSGATAAEIARSGGGVIVAPGDPAALLGAVRRVVADPGRAAVLGRRGRDHALRHLSRSSARDRIVRFAAAVHSGATPPTEVDDDAELAGPEVLAEGGHPTGPAGRRV